MAPHDAACGEPRSANRAVPLHRFQRILRTRRHEAARRRQRRGNETLISPNDEGETLCRNPDDGTHRSPLEGLAPTEQVGAQAIEARGIRFRTRAQHHVERRNPRLHAAPPEFLEPAAQAVARHRRLPEAGHNYTDASKAGVVAGPVDVEVSPAGTLSLIQHVAGLGELDQPARAPEALAAVRRARASNRSKRSGACDPSCGGAKAPHGPSGLPSACGIRASQSGACCEACMSASW